MNTPSKRRAPVPKTDPTAVPEAEQQENLPPLSRLIMTGSFVEQVTVVPRSMSSLILANGFLEDENERSVLLPFVEMMFAGVRQGEVADGETNPKLETVFSRTLPLENALWLTFDVVRDIRIACARLRGMIEGQVSFDSARITHARFFAEQLRMEAELCAALLEELTRPVQADESAD